MSPWRTVRERLRASQETGTHLTVRMQVVARRRRRGQAMTVLTWVAAGVALLLLFAILGDLVVRGVGALTPQFFVRVPAPAGAAGGGMANGIVGTLLLLVIASVIGVPVGLGAGLFLADHATTRLARFVRFLADVLSGLPSIVVGIFVWELLVRPVGHFSGWAGGVALGLLIVPLVARATEEMARLVPTPLVEAALALGYSHWRTGLTVVLRTALPGVVTATLVAIARAAGETAPLLFTAFGNTYWSVDLSRPMAALPLQIFQYAASPYDEWRAQAWSGALVIVLLVASMSLIAHAVLRARRQLARGAARRIETTDA